MEYLLIDIMSIQKYVFNSNKLKDNFGASFIIAEKVFDFSNFSDYELIYRGGGNAVLKFEKGKRVDFIKDYSYQTLKMYPGLKLAFGLAELVDNKEKECISILHNNLKENKNRFSINTLPFKPGIVADCQYTQEASVGLINDKLVSASVMSKFRNNESAKNSLIKTYKDVLQGQYIFPAEFNDFGQQEGDNKIAIVHIDGNGIGELFRNTASFENLKDYSERLSEITKNSVEHMITILIEYLKNNETLLNENGLVLKKEDNDGQFMLPMRPLVIGGDDITFVCNAKLALMLTDVFISNFKTQFIEVGNEKVKLEASAGISIVNTSFPFYRAYQFAEKAISLAKKNGKNLAMNTNLFYPSSISYVFANSGHNANLKYYSICDESGIWGEALQELKENITHFSDAWSLNKIQEYRTVLNSIHINKEGESDSSELTKFQEFAKSKGLSFPKSNLKTQLQAIELNKYYLN